MADFITKRSQDYSKWYNDIINQAGLADYSDIRGFMVIKPYGFAIWEKIQQQLDKMFKATGHSNAYFPLFIPKSLFEAEEKNAAGFAKECAVVTHYRLKSDKNNPGKLVVDPQAKLEEELIVRPTSEAIIWKTYKSWIESYRDLPLLINQWANVVRWEMRTRLFLRTSEFLWQEGHTAHSTKQEAVEETEKMIKLYADFCQDWMAMPVIQGVKSSNERFAGAENTYTIEALMQDGKALQSGTSHFLGQNFAKAFDVKYTSKAGKIEHVWSTSWGVSTRLMGGLIMTHSDDYGLVLPPKLAPIQVVIIPIYKGEEQLSQISEVVRQIQEKLEIQEITVKYDNRDTLKPGRKFAEYEVKGVPLRIAIGKRDIENNVVEVARRDTLEKQLISIDRIPEEIPIMLEKIQKRLFEKAQAFKKENTREVGSWEEFKEVIDKKGGFVSAYWDGTTETELAIKEKTKATLRCIPLSVDNQEGKCVYSKKYSKQKVIFAKAY